jgi:hypothetical protein
MLKILTCRASSELSDYLLCSRRSTWLVSRIVFGAVTTLLYFAWMQSFHTWGANVDGLVYHLLQ